MGVGPPLRAAAGTPPPLPPSKIIINKKRERKTVLVWNLAAELTWPSAKIKTNGNGFGPGSGQEKLRQTLASPGSTACGPAWPNLPSPKEILLYKCKNRSRFFYFSRRPACTLSEAKKQPRLEGNTVHVFLF